MTNDEWASKVANILSYFYGCGCSFERWQKNSNIFEFKLNIFPSPFSAGRNDYDTVLNTAIYLTTWFDDARKGEDE